MEIHGKRYLVPLANPDGTREYSMVYLNGEGKIEEHARWKDPIAVRALDEALPSTVGSCFSVLYPLFSISQIPI